MRVDSHETPFLPRRGRLFNFFPHNRPSTLCPPSLAKNDLPTLFCLSLFRSPGLLIISRLVLARYRMNAWLYDPIAQPITDHHGDGEERDEANPRGSTRRGQGGVWAADRGWATDSGTT
ncbi:hypothetical protein ALC60_07536 [Trachymyrmex zeteki]|uniref:Uncharacterized protein n=1 Tax=Mycetomoellerius zeteki TaxID=64791 RepID=A0A151WZL6_9HYME|nr:hypothetical protein ALC60_07536 [Trachymyrmex zeteki]